MDDIVQRLIEYEVSAPEDHPVRPDICLEAAKYITTLRQDIEWRKEQFAVLSESYFKNQNAAKLGDAVRNLVFEDNRANNQEDE